MITYFWLILIVSVFPHPY